MAAGLAFALLVGRAPAAAEPNVDAFGARPSSDVDAVSAGVLGLGEVAFIYLLAMPVTLVVTGGLAFDGRGDGEGGLAFGLVYGAMIGGEVCLVGAVSDGGTAGCPNALVAAISVAALAGGVSIVADNAGAAYVLGAAVVPGASMLGYELAPQEPVRPSILVPAAHHRPTGPLVTLLRIRF